MQAVCLVVYKAWENRFLTRTEKYIPLSIKRHSLGSFRKHHLVGVIASDAKKREEGAKTPTMHSTG